MSDKDNAGIESTVSNSELIETLGVEPAYQVWECKLVIPADIKLPPAFDAPPRSAVQMVIERENIPILVLFSGWGGTLTDGERLVVKQMNP